MLAGSIRSIPTNFREPRHEIKVVESGQARGGPQPLAMPYDNAISSERLDSRHDLEAKQPLKVIQSTLALEHQADNCALRLDLVRPLHRKGR